VLSFQLVVESDLAFLPVLPSRSTRKQFHSDSRDTAVIKGIELMTGELQLTCSDCGQEFTFSNEDQAFFRERGYSTPKRCKTCRQAKKNEQTGGGGYYRRNESQSTTVTCSGCGKQTTVPFEPRGDRPVYCQDCYRARQGSGSGRGGRRQSGINILD
jgi:CxxC-x17-CxxC domain-containing protein